MLIGFMMLHLIGTKHKKYFHILWIFMFTFSVDAVTPTALLSPSSPVQAEGVDGYFKELPERQLRCTAPGFKRYEDDCTKFYRCVNFNRTTDREVYTIVKFTCGPGTVFDESNSVCTWPHLASPPCTDKYRPTTISSLITQGTIPTFTPSTQGPSTQFSTLSINNITTKSTSGAQVTTKMPSIEWADTSGICRAPGFWRNETDCTQFYRCVNFNTADFKIFTIFRFTCGPGTVFDQKNSVCSWPHLANPPCSNKEEITTAATVTNSPQTPVDVTVPGTVGSTISNNSTSQVTTQKPHSECTDNTGLCRAPGFKRNETDCTRFYRCVEFETEDIKMFTIFKFSCGPGTVFDEKNSVCTWPHLANPPCFNFDQTAISSENSTTVPSTTISTSQATTYKPSTELTDNTGLCRAPGFKRNETDCTKFYRCVDFNMEDDKEVYTIFSFDCDPGTVFDEILSVCTWPHLANPPCTNNNPTTISPQTTLENVSIFTPTTVSSTTKSTLADPTVGDADANPFTGGSTPTQTSTLISTTPKSTTSQATTRRPSSVKPDITGLCTFPGYRRNQTDCTQFYRCVDFNMEDDKEVYTIYSFTCDPAGTVFDEILSVCTWPHLANPPCSNNNQTTISSTTTLTTVSSTKMSTTKSTLKWTTTRPTVSETSTFTDGSTSTKTSTTPKSTTSQITTSEPLSESTDNTGLCRAPGYWRNKTDCTQFYRCVDFNMEDDKEVYTVFKFACGPGTVFNEILSVCTWPHLVNPPCPNDGQTTTISSQITVETTSNFTPTPGSSTPISTIPNNTTLQDSTYELLSESTDTTGLCKAPGFKRNATDCTQFYRCVDFNMEDDKEIYTVFKFACDPGTVFDEILSVCTWPHLANPPCASVKTITQQ